MNPQDLLSDRIQLHYAIQFIAATGMALGTAQPDGSQMTLDWDDELSGFIGQKISPTSIQVALLPQTLTSVILQNRQPVASLSLVGQTLVSALDWHQAELAKLGIAAETVTLLTYPPDDFPDHALAQGGVFEAGNATARQTLAAYYAATRPLLAAVMAQNLAASPICIWPHHFDMATLMTFAGATEAETQYLGVGLSPGDQNYSEPYWYITPYPYPDVAKLPPLPQGDWHTKGWVGAVLTASQTKDQATVPAFIDAAVAAAKDLLAIGSGQLQTD